MMKKILAAVGAMAIVIGGGIVAFSGGNTAPKLAAYVDEDGVVQIQEDETPLARSYFRFANANDDNDVKKPTEETTVIDGIEVPLAKMQFQLRFANTDEPYTDPVVEQTIEDDDTPL